MSTPFAESANDDGLYFAQAHARAGGPPFLLLPFLDITIFWVPYPLLEKPLAFCGGEGKGGIKIIAHAQRIAALPC